MTVYFIQEVATHQKQVIKNRYLVFLAGNITGQAKLIVTL